MKSSIRQPVGGFLIQKGYPYWTFYWNGEKFNVEDNIVNWIIWMPVGGMKEFDDVFEALDFWDEHTCTDLYSC